MTSIRNKNKVVKKRARAGYAYWALGVFTMLLLIFLILFNVSSQENRDNVLLSIQNTRLVTPNPPDGSSVPSLKFLTSPTINTFVGLDSETIIPTSSLPPVALFTSTPTVRIEPTYTSTINPFYLVNSEDQLDNIAGALHVSPQSIRNANGMFGDAIIPGQILIIPTSDPIPGLNWSFASLDKEQADVYYPSYFDSQSFRMHYVPGTYPSFDPAAVATILENGLSFIENRFGKLLDFPFDIYVAGTFYELPNTYLRGRSFSAERKVFFLHNGSGDTITQQYFAVHELTHLYAWNTFGAPASFLVSEGAAVYTGMKMIESSQYIPINTFCAAYQKEDSLPLLEEKVSIKDFRGHNNNLVNYYSAGCFIGYLIETYGIEKFAKLYSTNDYTEIYGKSLDVLEGEWKASIDINVTELQLDSHRLVNSVNTFMAANEKFYYAFNSSDKAIQAYLELDKARLALISGKLDVFDQSMSNFQSITQGP